MTGIWDLGFEGDLREITTNGPKPPGSLQLMMLRRYTLKSM